jgi:hypothetical protein
MCGLAAATKLYGFFFFLAIAGYLAAGLLKKYLNFKTMVLAGLGFVIAMGLAILYASPFLLVPSAQRSMVEIMSGKTAEMAQGYPEPDPEGVYEIGLGNWLKYFEFYYGKPYFFFLAWAALVLGSLWGSAKYLNRLFLGWSLVVAVYLIYFIAVKPFHYILPLALPLYAGVFTLPGLLDEPALSRFFAAPAQRWVWWGLLALGIGGQFALNLWDIFTSPYIRVYF